LPNLLQFDMWVRGSAKLVEVAGPWASR